MKIKMLVGEKAGEIVEIDPNIGTYLVACREAEAVPEKKKPVKPETIVIDDPEPKPVAKKRGRKPKKVAE